MIGDKEQRNSVENQRAPHLPLLARGMPTRMARRRSQSVSDNGACWPNALSTSETRVTIGDEARSRARRRRRLFGRCSAKAPRVGSTRPARNSEAVRRRTDAVSKSTACSTSVARSRCLYRTSCARTTDDPPTGRPPSLPDPLLAGAPEPSLAAPCAGTVAHPREPAHARPGEVLL